MNVLTAKTSSKALPPQPSGRKMIPAYDCVFRDEVRASDMLMVDFDCHSVQRSGLHLVEMFDERGVTWRGCRRFDIRLDGHVWTDWYGDAWQRFEQFEEGIRVVGRVETVYRPVGVEARQ